MKQIRITSVLAALLLVSGCASNPQMWSYRLDGQRYQLLEIGGQPYFLDQQSAKLYRVEQQADGRLDIGQLAGEIGKAP